MILSAMPSRNRDIQFSICLSLGHKISYKEKNRRVKLKSWINQLNVWFVSLIDVGRAVVSHNSLCLLYESLKRKSSDDDSVGNDDDVSAMRPRLSSTIWLCFDAQNRTSTKINTRHEKKTCLICESAMPASSSAGLFIWSIVIDTWSTSDGFKMACK